MDQSIDDAWLDRDDRRLAYATNDNRAWLYGDNAHPINAPGAVRARRDK
jgi:hypothetical protein